MWDDNASGILVDMSKPLALKIDIYMSEICGSYHQLREHMNQALDELDIRTEITYHTVLYEEAVACGIKGSPSIWINGRDAFDCGSALGIV